MNEENESEIFCYYFPNLPNNNPGAGVQGGKALKIVAGLIPNLLTQNVLARSLDVSDSQAKG